MINAVNLYVSQGLTLHIRIQSARIVPIYEIVWYEDGESLSSTNKDTGRSCHIYRAVDIDADVPDNAYVDRDCNAAVILRALQKGSFVSFDEQPGYASVVFLKNNFHYVGERRKLSHEISTPKDDTNLLHKTQ